MKKLIIAAMVLSVAAISFIAGGLYGTRGPGGSGIVASDRPGKAPSGMPTDANPAAGQDDMDAAMSPGAVNVSPARQQLIGVKVAAVEKKPLVYTLRLYGRVVPDETRVYRLNASTDSWVREISGASTGSLVDKDEVLAEMLAPAFFNAQNNYVIQLGQMDRIRQQLGGELRPQQTEIADTQIRMALQSLQTLGIGDAQIAELAKTRKARPYLQVRSPARGVVLSRKVTLNQWFKAGEEFYTIADIRRVWVYADAYEDEAMPIRPGMTVAVKQGQMGKTFSARVGQVLPLFDPGSRTLKVRLDVNNPRYDLRPDMFVDVEIPITLPPSLSVPAGAVLDTGKKAIVYVDRGNGVFEPRRVQTGQRLGGQVEITGGLAAGEKIVVSGNFLIDSESRMELTASGAEDPTAGEPVKKDRAEKKKGSGKTSRMVEKSPNWAKPLNPEKADKNIRDTGRKPQTPSPDAKNGKEKPSEGTYPFPGAQYLGTVPRDPAPAEDEPPEDKLPPRQFEIPATPPSGTRLK